MENVADVKVVITDADDPGLRQQIGGRALQVFISWSGDLSHRVALVLVDWLPSVLQPIESSVSSKEINKGARWATSLMQELESHDVAIICLTPQNLTAPWINFEAGALSKLLSDGRVIPLFLGLNKSDVGWPMAQFQITVFEREDILRMLLSINRAGETPIVDEGLIQRLFDRMWPRLEAALLPLIAEATLAITRAPANPPHDTIGLPDPIITDVGTQSSERRTVNVFLCHSSGDKEAVRRLFRRLYDDGVKPWLDEEDLLPGQEWESEIRSAVRSSDVVVVCLSQASVTKEGFVQKEITFALDEADKKPPGSIFLIPLRLEECEVPGRLRRWHWVDLFDERGYDRLMQALRTRAAVVGATI